MSTSSADRPRSWPTIVAGLVSLAALIGFAVGVPFVLLRVRPNPWPERWPTWSRVITLMKAGTIDSAVLPNVVAVLVWACWAGMTLCVLAEIFGRLRGRSIHIPVISTGFGGLSRRWVGTIAAMIAMLLPQGVVSASPMSGRVASASSAARVVAAQSIAAPSSLTSSSRANIASAPSIAMMSSSVRPSQSKDSSVDSASVLSPSNGSNGSNGSNSSPTSNRSHASPIPQTDPATTSGSVVVVQPGDSYWELADNLTGDGFKWRELLAANVGRTMPDGYVITDGDQMLRAGWELSVPSNWAHSTGGGWHDRVVMRGDTLSKIAADEYGSADQWRTIAADNRAVVENPNIIIPGEVLAIRNDGVGPAGVGQAGVGQAKVLNEAASTASSSSTSPGQLAPPSAHDVFAFPESAQPLPDFQHLVRSNDLASEASTSSTDIAAQPDRPSHSAINARPGQNDQGDHGPPIAPLVGFAGLSSALAATVLWRLKRQRDERHVLRKLTTTSPQLTSIARQVELSYRAIADDSRMGWLDAALLLAQHRCKGTGASVHMICAHRGWIQLLLDHPVEPQAPFEHHNDVSWKLSTSVDRSALVDPHVAFASSLPFMMSLGDAAHGPVWVSLDDLESLDVVCDNADISDAVLSSWAVQLLAVPWSEERSVVLIGAPDSVQRLAHGTHAECVSSSAMIDPRSWMTERVTILSFVGCDPALDALVAHQASRVVVLAASRDVDPSRVDAITLSVDASTLHGVLTPGDVELSVVSLAGPSQLAGVSDLIGVTETVDETNPQTGALSAPSTTSPRSLETAWDASAEPIVTSAALTWSHEQPTVELDDAIDSTDEEPSITVPIPTFEFTPSPTTVDDKSIETARDFIARLMAPKPVELYLLRERPAGVIVGSGSIPTQSVNELLLFLAVHGPVKHEDLIGSLYPTRRIERSAVRQLVWRARQSVGNVLVGGEKTIGLDEGGYGLDWHRFIALTNFASSRCATNDFTSAIASLEQALQLVSALPWGLEGPSPRGEGEWAISIALQQDVLVAMTNAATMLAQLAIDSARPELATWACQKVLSTHSFPNIELVELGLAGAMRAGQHEDSQSLARILTQAQDDLGVTLSPLGLKMMAELAEPLRVGR